MFSESIILKSTYGQVKYPSYDMSNMKCITYIKFYFLNIFWILILINQEHVLFKIICVCSIILHNFQEVTDEPQLFIDGATRFDVKQGELGRWLMEWHT